MTETMLDPNIDLHSTKAATLNFTEKSINYVFQHGIGGLVYETDPILHKEPTPWIFNPPQADAVRMHRVMIENMVVHKGLGLSANQIGMPVKVFAMRVDDSDNAICCFNPVILKESNETVMMKEGCLSYPSLYLNIQRPEIIEAKYQNADGKDVNVHFEGLAARIFHHEMDHMNGQTFIDRVSKVFLQSARRKQKRLLRKGRRNGRAN